jgi:Ca2+/Na+ antiporter
MPKIFSLTCPSCGGKLQITSDIDRFSCGHCGNELIVQRSGGVITIAPVVEGLREVKASVDRTASELAIPRLEREIALLTNELDSSEEQAKKERRSNLFFLIILFFGLVALLDKIHGFGFIIGVLALVVLFIFANKKAQEKAQKNDQPIELAIDKKEQELEKHRNIVRNI